MKKISLFVLSVLLSTHAFSKDNATAVCTILKHVANRQPLSVGNIFSQEEYENHRSSNQQTENQSYDVYRQAAQNAINENNSDIMLARTIYDETCPPTAITSSDKSKEDNEESHSSDIDRKNSSKTKVMLPQ